MTNKRILSALVPLLFAGISTLSWAHEGHAPPGPVHELHHLLWLLMPLSIGAILVFRYRQRKKDRT